MKWRTFVSYQGLHLVYDVQKYWTNDHDLESENCFRVPKLRFFAYIQNG